MAQVEQYVQDPLVLSLLWGYLKRVVNQGGWWRPITQGISLGCPLSPLMGALYLKPLDDRMAQLGVVYVRFDRYLHHWGRWVRAGLGQRLMPGPVDRAQRLTYLDNLGYVRDVVPQWVRNHGYAQSNRARVVDR
jgi:hypothetical protein